MANKNLEAYRAGNRYRIEVFTANMARCEPEFAKTRAAADRAVSRLRKAGYVVTLFYLLATGGLTFARR